MEGVILLPAIYRGSRDLQDKTKNLTFQTNEVTPLQAGNLQQLVQEFCYLAIKKEPFSRKEIDLINDLRSDYQDMSKTPAQRLRAVLFLNWKQNNEGYEDFQFFYNFVLEGLINHYKSLLP